MNEAQKTLSRAFDMLQEIRVSGGDVERMCEAKKIMAQVYLMLEDHGETEEKEGET